VGNLGVAGMIPLRRLALALLLCLALVGGASASPFEVTTYADLCKVGTGTDGWTADSDYIQTADIQCPTDSNFPRIGLNPGTPFTGTYDGQGHEIRNLHMDYSDFQTGMFIDLGPAGILQNITLVDVEVTGTQSRLGALVGASEGTISGCVVSGEVSGTTYTGGLIGLMTGGSVTNCQSSCTIISGDQSGGLIGYAERATITNCHADVEILGEGGEVGGLIGWVCDSTEVSGCSASGTITAGDWGAGGLIGYAEAVLTITNCHSSATVTGTGGGCRRIHR
jgi:hypothetical protein